MNPLPDLADLIWAFEDEPRYFYEADDRDAGYELDWREQWPYTRVVFTLRRGERTVSLDLQPGYEQARLCISDSLGEVVDLLLRNVKSLDLDRAKGRVVLKIAFAEQVANGAIFMQLNPQISLGWEPFSLD